MDAEEAKSKLLSVAQELGHEIRIYTNPATSVTSSETLASSNDEPDDFYDFTPEDYYRLMSDKLGDLTHIFNVLEIRTAQSQILKTRKMREAEIAARRARITKAVIRVLFPDNYIIEIKFNPSEKIQSLMDLLMKVVARPDLPFYLYTTPPKELIKDTSKDFYTAGFVPGAIVYFSYDVSKDSDFVDTAKRGPYLREDILSLNGLDLTCEQASPVNSDPKPAVVETSSVPEPKPSSKKPTKPKWLKL